MRTRGRLIGPRKISSEEPQRPFRPMFACSKDRIGRCQLLEDRRPGQGKHLSPPEQQRLESCGTELCSRPKLNNVEILVQIVVDRVLARLLSCVKEDLEVLRQVSTQRLNATHKVSIRALSPG